MNGDQRLEDAIGRVLRFGGMTSSVCLAVGLGLALTHGAAALSSVLLTTGLVILMATPAARVVVSLGEYAIEHAKHAERAWQRSWQRQAGAA